MTFLFLLPFFCRYFQSLSKAFPFPTPRGSCRGTKPKPSMGGPKPGQKGGARERVVASAAHFLFPFGRLEGKGKGVIIHDRFAILIINDDGRLEN